MDSKQTESETPNDSDPKPQDLVVEDPKEEHEKEVEEVKPEPLTPEDEDENDQTVILERNEITIVEEHFRAKATVSAVSLQEEIKGEISPNKLNEKIKVLPKVPEPKPAEQKAQAPVLQLTQLANPPAANNQQTYQNTPIAEPPQQLGQRLSLQQEQPNTISADDEESGETDPEEEVKNRFVDESPNGRFKRFDEELGKGAYKLVYRGVDHDTGREVAWSIISLGRLPKAERPRIKSEINIIKSLNHPNIINFIGAWICKEKDQIHFITEMITGGSLRQYLKRMVKPKLKVIKNWCIEILKGLNYLHTYKIDGKITPIIHRDIKCDNIFINSNSGEIKIGDLGLSTTMKNSYTSSVLGTPEFMAPELYEEYYGTEVDIYAFGMALLEMLTREAPYRECQNPAQIYRKVVNRDFPLSLSRILDDQVREFIMSCLDDRSKRPTAQKLLEHPFLQDLTAQNNELPCSVSENPSKVKTVKKKLVLKNPMEEIPEEEVDISEQMDIKDGNHLQVQQQFGTFNQKPEKKPEIKQEPAEPQKTQSPVQQKQFQVQAPLNEPTSESVKKDPVPQEQPKEWNEEQDEDEENKDKKLEESYYLFNKLNDAKDMKLQNKMVEQESSKDEQENQENLFVDKDNITLEADDKSKATSAAQPENFFDKQRGKANTVDHKNEMILGELQEEIKMQQKLEREQFKQRILKPEIKAKDTPKPKPAEPKKEVLKKNPQDLKKSSTMKVEEKPKVQPEMAKQPSTDQPKTVQNAPMAKQNSNTVEQNQNQKNSNNDLKKLAKKQNDIDKKVKIFKEDDMKKSSNNLLAQATTTTEKKIVQPVATPQPTPPKASPPAQKQSDPKPATTPATDPPKEDQRNPKFKDENSNANTYTVLQKKVVRGKNSDAENSSSCKRGITNNLVKKMEELSEKPTPPLVKAKTLMSPEEEWNVVPDKKKTTEEQVVKKPLQQKEPEKILMKIQIQDKEVNFEYNLRKDTAEVVAKEFVSEIKFNTKNEEQNYYETFKERIIQQLEKYYSNRKKLREQQMAETASVVSQAFNVSQNTAASASSMKEGPNKVPSVTVKKAELKRIDSRSKIEEVKSSTATTKKTNLVAPTKPKEKPLDYHTDEFIKRRDEFKQIYKNMNSGIREFFKAMNKQGLDIDQVLNVMDYVEEGDRKHKKNFIVQIQQIHQQFLLKKTNNGGSVKQLQPPKDKKPAASLSQSQNMQSKPIQKPSASLSSSQVQKPEKSLDKPREEKPVQSKKMIIDAQVLINEIKAAQLKGKEIETNVIQDINLNPMKVDGVFGEITEHELKKIQEKLNIEPQTGVISNELIQKMQNLLTQIQFKNEERTALRKQQKKVMATKSNSTSQLEPFESQQIQPSQQQEEPFIEIQQENEAEKADEPQQPDTNKTPIGTILEVELEEQGSSGTNPLSKTQQYDADLDLTQISMNSKEETIMRQPNESSHNQPQSQIESEEQKKQSQDQLPPQNGSRRFRMKEEEKF